MPQTKRVELDGKIYEVPADATLDEIDSFIKAQTVSPMTDRSGGFRPMSMDDASTGALPKPPQQPYRPIGAELGGSGGDPIFDFIKQNIPTQRTLLQGTGAAIGGAAGAGIGGGIPGMAIGGAIGSGVGEMVNQVFSDLGKEPDQRTPPLQGLKDTGTAALGGVLQETTGPLAAKILNAISRRQGLKILTSSKIGADRDQAEAILPEMIGRIPARPTARGVSEAVGGRVVPGGGTQRMGGMVGKAVDEMEKVYLSIPPTVKFKTKPVVDHIRQLRNRHMRIDPSTGKSFVRSGYETQVKTYDDIIRWLESKPLMNVQDLRKDKDAWYHLVEFWKKDTSTDPARDEAWKNASGAIRELIESQYPAVGTTSKEVNLLLKADRLITEEAKRRTAPGSGLFRLGDVVAGSAGAGVVGQTMGIPAGAGGFIAAVAIHRLINSMGYQTASLAVKQKVLRLLENGAIQEAAGLLAAAPVRGIQNRSVPISLTPQDEPQR